MINHFNIQLKTLSASSAPIDTDAVNGVAVKNIRFSTHL
jgi:hypothetical protein